MTEPITDFLGLVALTVVPYALCSLGIMITGRTGIFNIAGEGIMMVGASAGFLGAYATGNPIVGVIAGLAASALYSLLLPYFSETLRINQFIIGTCLFVFGMGLADLIYKSAVGLQTTAAQVPTLPKIPVPGLDQIPIVSALFNQNVIVYFSYVITAVLFFLLFKTRLGLSIRAVGENPKAADVVGINVTRTRYTATIVGGALMGIAGAYFPLEITGTYMPLITGGRGFIAVGLTIFASWKPERILAGSFLFAGVEALAYKLQIVNTGIPYEFLSMLPFITVLVLMLAFYKRAEYPAAIGSPYSRE